METRENDSSPKTFIWGQEVWNQADSLSGYTSRGIDLLDKYSRYLKDRARLESDYAQGLRSLEIEYAGSAGSGSEDHQDRGFSSVIAFRSILDELQPMASQKEQLAAAWTAEALDTIDEGVKSLRDRQKECIHNIRLLEKFLDEVEKSSKKFQRRYLAAWLAWQRAEQRAQKYDNNAIFPVNAMFSGEKARAKASKRQLICEEARAAYENKLKIINQTRQAHFASLLPSTLEDLRKIDAERICLLRDVIERSVASEKEAFHAIDKQLDNIQSHAHDISEHKDALFAVETFRSWNPLPGNLPLLEPQLIQDDVMAAEGNEDSESTDASSASSASSTPGSGMAGKILQIAKSILPTFGRRHKNLQPDISSDIQAPRSSIHAFGAAANQVLGADQCIESDREGIYTDQTPPEDVEMMFRSTHDGYRGNNMTSEIEQSSSPEGYLTAADFQPHELKVLTTDRYTADFALNDRSQTTNNTVSDPIGDDSAYMTIDDNITRMVEDLIGQVVSELDEQDGHSHEEVVYRLH